MKRNENTHIAEKIKSFRKRKKIRQADLDEMCDLPVSTISKIETGKREATAIELVYIARALGVTLNAFSLREESHIYNEEIKVVEALREIPFEDYRQLLRTLESQVYFAAKDAKKEHKEFLMDLVADLSGMTTQDLRPRSPFDKLTHARRV